MSQETMLYAAIGAGIVLLVVVAMHFEGQKNNQSKRIRAISEGVKARAGDTGALKRKQIAETVKGLREREAAARDAKTVGKSIKDRMRQAGWSTSPSTFWAASAVFGVVAFVGIFLAGFAWYTAAGISFAAALGVPRWFLGMAIKGRQKKFVNQFADALDVIVRGVKSGLPLNECLRVIASESPQPLAEEFDQVCDSMAMGVSLDQAMEKLYQRTPIQEVNFFSIVLSIQQKAGGNLSEALGNLSVVIRSRKLLKEKIKALSSEAKASAMIIGALPIIVMLLVYLTTPEYISELFTSDMGHLILLVAAGLMGTGIYIMRQMINFDF